MYCCEGFAHRIAAAGSRGLAVLVHNESEGLSFFLQSRGVAFADQSRLRPAAGDLTINIAADVGMLYCPWCGRRLEDLIAASPQRFRKLAEQHDGLAAVELP